MELLYISLLSFSNFLLSLPFTYFGLTKFGPDDITAYWQPPGYVFGIVWSILYTLLGLINLKHFLYLDDNEQLSFNIISQGLAEAFLQAFWLLVTSNFGNGRQNYQYVLGFFVIYRLVDIAWNYRGKLLYRKDRFSFYLYFPYMLWILFAMILNLQILYKIYL